MQILSIRYDTEVQGNFSQNQRGVFEAFKEMIAQRLNREYIHLNRFCTHFSFYLETYSLRYYGWCMKIICRLCTAKYDFQVNYFFCRYLFLEGLFSGGEEGLLSERLLSDWGFAGLIILTSIYKLIDYFFVDFAI